MADKGNNFYIWYVIFGVIILILAIIGYKSYLIKSQTVTVITENSTPSEIEKFCKDIEVQLKAQKIWDTDEWKCVLAYDEGLPVQDIIYNKTRGLCNCTATLPNGKVVTYEVRQSK